MKRLIIKLSIIGVFIILTVIFTAVGFCANAMATDSYSFTVITDTTAPYTDGHVPASSATNITLGSNIVVHVKDDETGVDVNTIVMKVNGVTVSPVITGTAADYTLTYDPSSDFQHGQTVYVTVDASDLAS
ncbi:MAG: Ig-like domain-containing protein [Candidatus Omnitrophica bacterium]|nr:Ig-like domain-containing protein [Candidatus Omnitrophota bacterium]